MNTLTVSAPYSLITSFKTHTHTHTEGEGGRGGEKWRRERKKRWREEGKDPGQTDEIERRGRVQVTFETDYQR